MKSNQNPLISNSYLRVFKYTGLFLLGILLLAGYFLMDHSTSLKDFMEKANRYRTDTGFAVFSIVGLIKYAFLLSGITLIVTVPIIVLFNSLKNRKSK